MSDNKSLIPDIIEPLSNAVQSNIPKTTNEVDETIATVVGFFNNVVLYPVKKANLSFRYKLEAFETDLKEKIKNIPAENLRLPPTMIVGPTLEALRYTYDEKDIREMYENLLASSMDTRIVNQVHPSFVDAIKQMSVLDAKVIEKIADLTPLPCSEIFFEKNNTFKIYTNAMPNYFVTELIDLGDPFDVSASLINLERLGLIKITEQGLKGFNYESTKEHPYVLARQNLYNNSEILDYKINLIQHAVILNNYGKMFVNICL